jgi:hypothetical protein
MIVPLVMLSCSTPTLRNTERPRQDQAATNDQQKADGSKANPLFVRLTQSEQDAANQQAERDRQAHATKVTEYTGFATLAVLVIQAVIFVCQSMIFGRQTRIFRQQTDMMRRQNELISGQLTQATSAAKTASNQLILASQAHLDITPLRMIALNVTRRDGVRDYRLFLNAVNITNALARVERIDTEYWIEHQSGGSVTSGEAFTLGSLKDRDIPVEIDLTPAQIEMFEQHRLVLRVVVMIEMRHPITGNFWHTYDQIFRFRGPNIIDMVRNDDYQGRIDPNRPAPEVIVEEP